VARHGNGHDDERPSGGPAAEDPPAEERAQALAPEDEAEPTGLSPVDPPAPADPQQALQRELDDLRDRLLRKTADFDNYRKRMERDRQQAGQEATAGALKALLPTLDNFERALEAGGSESTLREGVELIRRDLMAALAAQGLTVDDPLGQKFDPTRHQALSHEPAPGAREGTIVGVLRKGYSLRDRLLRPALVKVARGESGPEGGSDPDKVH
jgi:molecular chaperone GrpE